MENINDKQFTFFRFEDLRVYHKSMDYALWVKQVSNSFSDMANMDLANKFNSAALSIAINIAEGSARNKSQFIYYLKMAKSVLRECLVYGSLACNMQLITEEEEMHSRNQLMEMTKMIGALISSLQRSAVKVDDESESDYDFDANSY
ncbi:MAG: four helix bundle protein [Bacteroidetes bacterium HGW-Bacteroidetes-17]|jgi:four helix bundle protein|nr:MAG: four helix bundle protein [Bacteroidetes bacterium HGW-Bacteroidetes-17]